MLGHGPISLGPLSGIFVTDVVGTSSFANAVRAELGAAVGVGDTTLTVATASSPYNDAPDASVDYPVRLTIVDNLFKPTKLEIVTYTGRSGAGPYTLTGVTRAQEGTSAQAFTTGYVYHDATAADFSAYSAFADLTTIGVLGTGTDTAFDSTDSLEVSHSTISSASRFKRTVAVYEYDSTDSSWDQLTSNYVLNMGAEDKVTVTKSTSGSKYINVVVFGPSS
jgi:hypothetical protein